MNNKNMLFEGLTYEDVVTATQHGVIDAIMRFIHDVKKEDPKRHGLTWEQINFILSEFRNKSPKLVIEET